MSTKYLNMRRYSYTDASGDRQTFYRHPSGLKIKREVRDWNAYGALGGNGGCVIAPKVQFVVYRGKSLVTSFNTLRSATAFCDENPEAS